MMVENLDITMNKNLMFCEEVGWNWHKSWNIPTISLAFEVKIMQ